MDILFPVLKAFGIFLVAVFAAIGFTTFCMVLDKAAWKKILLGLILALVIGFIIYYF